MTLRRLIALAVLVAAPAAAVAADPAPQSQGGEQAGSGEPQRSTLPRKPDRRPQGAPSRPRIVDAPGAALMLIPASFTPRTR